VAPRAIVEPGARFHDNGSILTAAGISAGIDCSLHLVGRLLGEQAATKTASYMEYERRR
jgi:transcriptional regulator GlxA family with amidase domain